MMKTNLYIPAGLLIALFSVALVSRLSDSSFIVDEGEQAAEGGEPL